MRTVLRFGVIALALVGVLVPPACSSTSDDVGGGGADAAAEAPKGAFRPGDVHRTRTEPGIRGLLDRRGIIHAHSVYSHDACDGKPRDEATDAIDATCLEDFRRGLCQSQHDFVMLTDHDESFSRTEFRELTLHDAAKGDRLVERDGNPVANWIACPGAPSALVLPGSETKTMPVGLEHHVAATPEERSKVYSSLEPADIEKLRAAGAVTLLQHTEDWTVEQLTSLPIDGFEMYNLHANAILGGAGVVSLAAKRDEPELIPYSDLVFVVIVNEDARYSERWGSVLATGARRVATMGTDCHRNTFQSLLPDGERMDSYRRMMRWFSNHLLVKPDAAGGFDDRALKEALKAGRLYGSFDAFGYPVGFDYRAESGAGVAEMGDEITVASGSELVVDPPTVTGVGEGDEPPVITTRILRARSGGWDIVAEGPGVVRHRPDQAGAYRAEVRMKPRHLGPWLASYAELAERDFVWIYANPIYVK